MNLNIESNTSPAACEWGVCLVRDVLHHACIMVENNHITAMTSMNNRTHSRAEQWGYGGWVTCDGKTHRVKENLHHASSLLLQT